MRSTHVGHLLHKMTPNPFWAKDTPVLEHVYAYIWDGIDEKERTIHLPWVISTCHGFIPGQDVHITFDRLKYAFDRCDAEEQTKALKRVNRYVKSYTERPDPHKQILERLLEIQNYFSENIKNKPTSLTIK